MVQEVIILTCFIFLLINSFTDLITVNDSPNKSNKFQIAYFKIIWHKELDNKFSNISDSVLFSGNKVYTKIEIVKGATLDWAMKPS